MPLERQPDIDTISRRRWTVTIALPKAGRGYQSSVRCGDQVVCRCTGPTARDAEAMATMVSEHHNKFMRIREDA